MKKIYSIIELKKKLEVLRKKKLLIGLTNGCFDLLHPGHIHLLNKAKNMCDYLIVAVNTDYSVTSLKGKNRPIEEESIRLNNLSSIKSVDALILFSDDTPLKLISDIVPDRLFKGSDYKNKNIIGKDIIQKNGGQVILINILDGYSTTNIINKSSI